MAGVEYLAKLAAQNCDQLSGRRACLLSLNELSDIASFLEVADLKRGPERIRPDSSEAFNAPYKDKIAMCEW